MSRVLILSLMQQQTEHAVTGAGVHGVCQVCFIKERFQDVGRENTLHVVRQRKPSRQIQNTLSNIQKHKTQNKPN